jgi:hypothetical protein
VAVPVLNCNGSRPPVTGRGAGLEVVRTGAGVVVVRVGEGVRVATGGRIPAGVAGDAGALWCAGVMMLADVMLADAAGTEPVFAGAGAPLTGAATWLSAGRVVDGALCTTGAEPPSALIARPAEPEGCMRTATVASPATASVAAHEARNRPAAM